MREVAADMDAVSQSKVWGKFGQKFQRLAEKEEELVRSMRRGDRRLRAACIYDPNDPSIDAELIDQERVSVLYRFGSGTWQLTAGPNENFKARFTALATRAGIALQPGRNIDALDFWLHNLCIYLRRSKSEVFFAGGNRGGYIEDVPLASATFCSWLETREAQSYELVGDGRLRSDATRDSAFTHSDDYRTVTLRGVTYTLTPRQAQIIEILHSAYESGQPDVSVHYILEKLETRNGRWQDTFKSNKKARQALISTGSGKGMLRLNL
jgi:hypothetical protein